MAKVAGARAFLDSGTGMVMLAPAPGHTDGFAMIAALATLLTCQLAGEAIVRVTALPVPGPVIGMVLLFALMLARARLPGAIEETAEGILKHLSLLFVPAGVGVVQHLELLATHGARLLIVLVISTTVALAVTALVFAAVARPSGQETDDQGAAGGGTNS